MELVFGGADHVVEQSVDVDSHLAVVLVPEGVVQEFPNQVVPGGNISLGEPALSQRDTALGLGVCVAQELHGLAGCLIELGLYLAQAERVGLLGISL